MEEEKKISSLKSQKPLVVVSGIAIGLGILGLVGMLAFGLGRRQAGGPMATPSPTMVPEAPETLTPTVTLTLTPTATPAATRLTDGLTPTIDETSLIKQAVYRLTGLDEIRAEITINRNTGRHATGTIKEFEAVGGAYWLAAKTAENWVGVYAGQANPTCSQIAPYDFPPEMVPECLDERGEVVGR